MYNHDSDTQFVQMFSSCFIDLAAISAPKSNPSRWQNSSISRDTAINEEVVIIGVFVLQLLN